MADLKQLDLLHPGHFVKYQEIWGIINNRTQYFNATIQISIQLIDEITIYLTMKITSFFSILS